MNVSITRRRGRRRGRQQPRAVGLLHAEAVQGRRIQRARVRIHDDRGRQEARRPSTDYHYIFDLPAQLRPVLMSSYRKSLRTTFAAFHERRQHHGPIPYLAAEGRVGRRSAGGRCRRLHRRAGRPRARRRHQRQALFDGRVRRKYKTSTQPFNRPYSVYIRQSPSALGMGADSRHAGHGCRRRACVLGGISSCRSRQLRSTRTAASGSCKGVRYERNRSTTMTASPLHAPPLGPQLALARAASRQAKPCGRTVRRRAIDDLALGGGPPADVARRARDRRAVARRAPRFGRRSRSRGSSRAARAACISCDSRTACSRLPRARGRILAAAVDVARHVAALRDA